MGRATGWGRRPHPIQYLLQIGGEAAKKYYSKTEFPKNKASMVPKNIHDFRTAELLGESRPHRSLCLFPRTQSQRTYIEGEILTISPTQLMHAVFSCFTTFADGRSLRAPCHTQPRAEASKTFYGSPPNTSFTKSPVWKPTRGRTS